MPPDSAHFAVPPDSSRNSSGACAQCLRIQRAMRRVAEPPDPARNASGPSTQCGASGFSAQRLRIPHSSI
eukprot:13878827-Alexandrium_andersonii.AAC.1